jgi:hypothetical protein
MEFFSYLIKEKKDKLSGEATFGNNLTDLNHNCMIQAIGGEPQHGDM